MPNSNAAVHPLQPRFAQAVTGVISLLAVIFQVPLLIVLATVLVLIALFAPQLSPVNLVFRRFAPPPTELEPVAPVRFAQWMAVGGLVLALVLLLGGATFAGWIVAAAIGGVALFSAMSGICVGCEIYRAALRYRSDGADLRDALGLSGAGPWLAVLTAPGCARCGPAIERTKAVAGDAAVAVVNLAQRPAAAAAPVASVPAVLAVGADGSLLMARAGQLQDADISAVVDRVAERSRVTSR